MAEAESLPPPLPPRLDWFVHTQVGQLAQDGVPEWFHGAISRGDAEDLLESQPPGSFLVRVSHSHVGYTLSYRVQGRCCHAMVILRDDGRLALPGDDAAHASLRALVAFYRHSPLRPHGQRLTRGCGQKDPAAADYQDLLLFAAALAQDTAGSEAGPRERRGPSPRPEGPPKSTLRHPPKEEKTEPAKATSPCSPRVPLGGAGQKLWKNLRALPETGRKVQQRLQGRLEAVSLASLRDAWPLAATHGSAARDQERPPRHQAPGGRATASRRAARPVSWSGATPPDRGWRHKVARALSFQPSEPEPRGWLPEEYLQPPPFAPGY